MSLYSYDFSLLPKPARSTLSIGDESTRAQLPDFASVDELRTFVTRLFIYRLDVPGLYVQLKLGASIICLLVLVVGAIIGRRMYDRSFWIIRIMKRPSGPVLVPNAMLCFSIIEGAYGGVFVALMWLTSRYFESHALAPTNYPLWILLTWIPLIIGAMWAAWGTYFATPSRTQAGSFGVGTVSIVQRFFEHALVINTMGLFFPLLIIISVTIPAALASTKFNETLRRQEAWLATYAEQTQFTQTMVQEAQSIWFALIDSMKVVSATFIIWGVWALAMFFVYTWVAVRLMRTIRKELKKSKTVGPRFGVVTTTRIISSREREEGTVEQRDPQSRLAPPTLDDVAPARDARKASLLSSTTAFGGHATNADEKGEPFVKMDVTDPRLWKTNSSHTENDQTNDIPMRPTQAVRMDAATFEGRQSDDDGGDDDDDDNVDDERRDHWRSYVPNIVMKKQSTVSTARPTRPAQMKELRKALIHISTQFFAISPACIAFLGIAMLLAVTTFGGTEQPWQGGIFFERTFGIALLAVTWTTCLFGAVTVLAIAERTYEPVFSTLHLTNTSNSSSGGLGGLGGGSGAGAAQSIVSSAGQSVRSPRSGDGDLNRSRSRRSSTLVRMLGLPVQRSGSHKKGNLRDIVNEADKHGRSTFFETRTRNPRSSSNRGGGNASSSGANLILRDRAAPDESMIDVEGAPGGAYSRDYDDQHDNRDSLDIARRGLFIESTIVTEEQSAASLANGSSGRPDSATVDRPTSSSARRGPSDSPHRHRQQQRSVSSAYNRSAAVRERDVVDSDDDDDYFRGGTGRRARLARPTNSAQDGTTPLY